MVSWEKTVEWAFVRNCLAGVDFAAPIDGTAEISDAILAKYGRWFLIEFKHQITDFKSEKSKYPRRDAKRTRLLLRDYSGISKATQKADLALMGTGWWARALQLEMTAKATLPARPPIVRRAGMLYNGLKSRYGAQTWNSSDPLEPHFFVFSQNGKFDKLSALPYWVDWKSPIPNARAWDVFDANLIALHGHSYDNFSQYVTRLAIARGYDLTKIGGSGSGSGGGVVFGYVAGFDNSRGVAMSLDSFLALSANLKAAYTTSIPSSTPALRKQSIQKQSIRKQNLVRKINKPGVMRKIAQMRRKQKP